MVRLARAFAAVSLFAALIAVAVWYQSLGLGLPQRHADEEVVGTRAILRQCDPDSLEAAMRCDNNGELGAAVKSIEHSELGFEAGRSIQHGELGANGGRSTEYGELGVAAAMSAEHGELTPPDVSAFNVESGNCTFGIEPYEGREWDQLVQNWKRVAERGGGIMQLHTRKTGGTSLRHLIGSLCEAHPSLESSHVEWGRFPALCFERNPDQEDFQSRGQDLLFVGTFRDPVDRVLSEFFHRGPGALLGRRGDDPPWIHVPGFTKKESIVMEDEGMWEAWMGYAEQSYNRQRKGIVVPGVYYPNLGTILNSGTCTKPVQGTPSGKHRYLCPVSESVKGRNKSPVGCSVGSPGSYSDEEMREALERAKRTVVSLDAVVLTSEANHPDFFEAIGFLAPRNISVGRSGFYHEFDIPPSVLERMRRDAYYDSELFKFATAVSECRRTLTSRLWRQFN